MKKKLLSVVISMITVFSLCILPVSAMRPDSDRVHDGIDVSEFRVISILTEFMNAV